MRSIRRKILTSIQPPPEMIRQEQRWARRLAARLERHAPRGGRVVVAGSIAKGTFLQNDKDVDLFLLLSAEVPKSKLEEITRRMVGRALPGQRYETKYAEHPYVRLRLEGRRVDIVPAYVIRNSSERISAVDRSVLHTRYILKHLPRGRVPDVLLLKRFLKSAELYGAEIKVQGFSGYLCELLVLHYKGFERCIRAISKWKAPVLIDPEGFYSSKNAKLEVTGRFGGPLVVIDPTDRNRNVAAAVSEETFGRLIRLCRRFQKKPALRFFQPPISFEEKLVRLRNQKGATYLMVIRHGPVVEDIMWGQLRKLAGQINAFLGRHGFEVWGHLLDSNERHAHIVIQLRSATISPHCWMPGPSLDLEKHVTAFKKAHRNAKLKTQNRRVWAQVRRPFVTGLAALHAFLESAQFPSHLEKKGLRLHKL